MRNGKKQLPEKLYDLIPSQQTMYMMVKYSFHKQLTQIPISFSVEKDLDFNVLRRAFNIEIERNDSLRIRFAVVDKQVKQYFLDSFCVENIEVKRFKNIEEQEAFFSKDAQKPVYFLKDEIFRVFFFKTEGVGSGIYLVVSHLNLDAMGIIITLADLLRVYRALMEGTEMPAPLYKFEDYIKEEFARLSDQKKMAKHREFYARYFLKGGEPFHANVHGPEFLEKYRKKKKNPDLRVPPAYNPLYDKCDMIVKQIPAEDAKKIFDYCLEKKIAPESLLQLGLRTYCSAVNYRTPDVFIQSLCSKRATNKEKNMGGCITQPLQLRTIIPEDFTFSQALDEITQTRSKLFLHSAYPYGLALNLSREIYNYNMLQGPACMMFSWIPVPIGPVAPFKFDFRGYNLGRYFTPLYVITHPDPETQGIKCEYMYRVKLANAEDINRLHENAVRVVLAGIENPEIKIGTLLDSIS